MIKYVFSIEWIKYFLRGFVHDACVLGGDRVTNENDYDVGV